MPIPEILIPDFDNIDIAKQKISLEKQLNETLADQLKSRDKIRMSLNLERQVLVQDEHIKRRINDLSKTSQQLMTDEAKAAASSNNPELFKAAAKGLIEKMSLINEEIKLQRELQALQLDAEIKKQEYENRWGNLTSKIAGEHFGFKIKEYELSKKITEELEKYPFSMKKYAGTIAVVVTMLKGAYDLFKKFDEEAFKFRTTMGFTRNESAGLQKIAQQLTVEFANVGVKIEGAYKAMTSLIDSAGSAWVISKDLIKTTALMSAQLGVAEETTAGFLHNMAAISKSTMQAQESTVYLAANLANAAGVNLSEVMKDVANRSTQTLTMMSRWPTQVIKTAVEARRLNTTITEMAKASRSLLDFADSVAAEMDASVLIGRGINLQLARELAYKRDIEGSTKEILRITKQIGFEGLDVFQQEAFAKATGRSVDELLRMVVAERQWEAARNDPTLSMRVKEYDALRASNEATLKTRGEDYKLMLEQKYNQEQLVAIQNKWNQLMMKAQTALLPLVDLLLTITIPVMDIAQGLFAWTGALTLIGTGILAISRTFMTLWATTENGLNFFLKIEKIGYRMLTPVIRMFSMFGKFAKFAGFLGPFVKVIPIIGWIIAGAQIIFNIFDRFSKIEWGDNIGENILLGIEAIAMGVFDALVKPFWDALKAIGGWLGFSPSKIGLAIVKGIVSVGAMIYDALTWPFRMGLAYILDKIPFMGKVAAKLRGGMSGLLENNVETKAQENNYVPTKNVETKAQENNYVPTKNVETKAQAEYIPAVTVTPQGTVLNPGQSAPATTATEISKNGEDLGTKLDTLIAVMNGLREDFSKGKIQANTYIDSQLMSATVARNTEFRNGFGVNKIT